MKWLNLIPLLRLVIPFSLGIILAFYQPTEISNAYLLTITIMASVLIIIIRLRAINSRFYARWFFGAFASIFLFFSGFIFANIRAESFNPKHFSNQTTSIIKPIAYQGVLISEPEEKTRSLKAVVQITQIKIDGNWTTSTGKCLVYFSKSKAPNLKYGTEITFLKQPEIISPPANFDEFNYKRYLSHHYIYHRIYLSENDYQTTGNQPPNQLKFYAIEWRNFLLKRYEQFGIEGNQLAIVSALTLGKKESISPELKTAYSSAGAMHVLAVSGLHVGIIFLLLRSILAWLDHRKFGSIIKAVLLILSIWFYAIITGLSPSVIRASTMFTFMIFAVAINRKSNIYNTIALSAFFILLFEPFMILEVGFQLSYLAVIGIVYLHPYLYNLISLKPGLINQAWNITCVSLAAQLATAPLGILYFHQFPSYFLFSNLIVIPAAFAIMVIAIGFQTFAVVPFLGHFFALFLNGIIWSLNWVVQQMEALPNSLISGLDISVVETWLLYSAILSLALWLTKGFRKYALYALLFILGLTTTQTIEKWNQHHQKQITIYDTGKQTAIEYVDGLNVTLIADSLLLTNSDRIQFHVLHHWWKRGLHQSNLLLFENLPYQQIALQFGKIRLLKFDKASLNSIQQIEAFNPHIIYVNYYKTQMLSELNLAYKPLIIIGNNTKKKSKARLITICKEKGWKYHDMKISGAVKVVTNSTEELAIYTPNTSLKE